MSLIDHAIRIARATGGKVDDGKFLPHNLRHGINKTDNDKRILIGANGPGKVNGIVVPRHMWEGGNGARGTKLEGMEELNKARASVYGSEPRDPLTVGKIGEIHRAVLEDHFKKPIAEQRADELASLERLRAAKHIGKTADTLDESEKLDTVRHERDEKGRTYVAYGSKGTAGHAVYSSGIGANQKFHVLNTCPGQTEGCGGGVDKHGIVDTMRGTCFAPNAESQYPGAAVRRAAHAQAKHDPAMTGDWILAHTGSLRRAAERADKKNQVTLFRPNVVDESDRSTRHVIRHLNKQRIPAGKPAIIANSYGKTNELHDPENGHFVTYSNTGPKTKHGMSVSENISRDKSRVRATILAEDAAGKHIRNDDGEKTPPKNSYMVTDVARGSEMDDKLQKAISHAKYWSTGRPVKSLSPAEVDEGPEAHYDGEGKPTSPDRAHYGHATLNEKRFDYQKQHILHPRLVHVGENADGSPHMIPTDSRFKDDDFLPKQRFKAKNGKNAGAIVLTTPTTSTSGVGRQTSFTHHVGDEHIEHALKNNGEYEIDPPHEQERSHGNEFKAPRPTAGYARGGHVHSQDPADDMTGFPEMDGRTQLHILHRTEGDPDRNAPPPESRADGLVKAAMGAVKKTHA